MILLMFILAMTLTSAYNCGNGICEGIYGNSETNQYCPQDCYCGDNICHFDETPTSCATDCYCGDGKCSEGEREAGCIADCPPMCGNDLIELGEVCDDGELNSDVLADACRTDCRDAYCTDGVTDSGEECDEGNHGQDLPNVCRDDCTLPYCGDGIVDDGRLGWNGVEFNEECDDGNDNDFDGCRNCQVMAGFNTGSFLEQPIQSNICDDIEDDTVITESTNLFFCNSELEDRGQEGIIIVEGFDITLDCNGKTITSSNNAGTGIVVKGDRILIKNCHVENFATGIKVIGGGNMLKSSSICGNDVDIEANMFTNYGNENHCDIAPNWFERVQGCSYQCDGKKNRLHMFEIAQECIEGVAVLDMAEERSSGSFLDKILSFFSFAEDSPVAEPDNLESIKDDSGEVPTKEGLKKIANVPTDAAVPSEDKKEITKVSADVVPEAREEKNAKASPNVAIPETKKDTKVSTDAEEPNDPEIKVSNVVPETKEKKEPQDSNLVIEEETQDEVKPNSTASRIIPKSKVSSPFSRK